jgi:thiol-disulfide isomerase/thioredoxin
MRTLALVLLLLSGLSTAGEDALPFQVGAEPPDHLGRDLDWTEIRLSDFPDRVRVVTFWASWCAPCLAELDMLERIQAQIPTSQLKVIAVNVLESNKDRVKRMLRRRGDELNLLYSFDDGGDLAEEYAIRALPLMMMIDGRGRIRQVHQGYGEDMLDQIVTEMNDLMIEQAERRAQVAAPVEE